MKTAVVILNWNTRDYLRRWLPGLIGSCARADAAVFVADSASTDGSMDFGTQIRLYRPLLFSCRVQQVYPEDVFFADSSKLRFGLAELDFRAKSVEKFDHNPS